MLIELNNVTLCAVGSADRVVAARALEISMAQCRFADAILFSHEPVKGSFRTVRIAPLPSMAAYTHFMLKEMHKLISTEYVLVTQWDGYVLNASSWRNEFLQYDYIGAAWPWKEEPIQIGNGGFSLRSRKLLETVAQPWFEIVPKLGEDELMCVIHRGALMQRGILFAPRAVADRFAYERDAPRLPTFGFHGMFNFWREVPDADLIQMLPQMPPNLFNHSHCAELLWAYYITRRWRPLRALFSAWRSHFSLDDIRTALSPLMAADALNECLSTCESLFQII